ncbi:ABC transporter ATP-binding protein, partial [Acinetobacter baumannii]
LHYGGVTARRKRNEGRKRRLDGMRLERREQRKVAGAVKLTVSEGEVSSKLVIDAEGVSKSYGDRVIVQGLDLRVRRNDRLGIIGPN